MQVLHHLPSGLTPPKRRRKKMHDELIVDPLFAPQELAQNERRKRAMMDLFISQEPVLIIYCRSLVSEHVCLPPP